MPGRIYRDDDFPVGSLFGRPPVDRSHAVARRTDPVTSIIAADDAKLTAGHIRTLIYEMVVAAPDGLTVDDIRAQLPPMAASTLSARASDLIRDGLLKDSGRKRNTRTGSAARVMVAVHPIAITNQERNQ